MTQTDFPDGHNQFFPLVSLIVRTLNRPQLLQEALQSICAQTYPNIEMVVINDGGEDIHEIVNDFANRVSALQLIQLPQNVGRSKAANQGLMAAKGEFVGFLDDDDTLDSDHIANLMQALLQNPENKAAYTGVRIEDNERNVKGYFNFLFDRSRLFVSNFMPIHAVLFSRSLTGEGGARFDENMDVYEDWDFWLQLALHTSFLHVDNISATYRAHGDSGVGLVADEDMQRQGREQLFEKWRLLWSGREINCLAQYALNLEQRLGERDTQIAHLNHAIAERDGQIANLNQTVAARDAQIDNLNQTVAACDAQIDNLDQTIAERDAQIIVVQERYNEALRTIEEIRGSSSWRLTAPIRYASSKTKNLISLVRLLPSIIRLGGGLLGSTKKAWRVFLREGWVGVKRRILFVGGHRNVISSSTIRPDLISGSVYRNDYAEWIRRYDTLTDSMRADIRQRIDAFDNKPLISVIMPTYNPKPEWLIEAIESVRSQIYPHWELCIADDASPDEAIRPILEHYAKEDSRIKVAFREKNGHISEASNSALELAEGSWLALLDHDDILSEHALFWVVDAINKKPDIRLIYSDEDKIDEAGKRFGPYFKCDWNQDLFYSHNLYSHLGVYQASLINEIGGFRKGFEGSQDYDLALRSIERADRSAIYHIPRVLYHWRVHAESTALKADAKPYAMIAGERAINDHFQRLGINAKATLIGHGYRVQYALPESLPLVSLIIPTRNAYQLIHQCVESIRKKTTYPNYEILIVDNGSDDSKTLNYLKSLESNPQIRVLRDNGPFNYSALNNAAVKQARGELIGLINNDIEVISPEWLSEMVSQALRIGVGAVGARLWYPDNTLQHGGLLLGVGGIANSSHQGFARNQPDYFSRSNLLQSFSAVTAACLVIKKSIYEEVGGLNEIDLQVAFNDVDFCLRVREAGYSNIWTPYAELYHHESATRGFEDSPKKQIRFAKETEYMKQRWGSLLLNDPAYSPNLSLTEESFSLAWPPRIERL
ncbi:MAG: glycosyltransferase [Methylobacter sp.]